MKAAPSLFWRALVAIALMVGFYVLAVAMIVLLLWIPYAEWTYAGRLHVKLVLFCIVGVVIISWSILPRVDRFQAPGPELKPGEYQELFRELVKVARAGPQVRSGPLRRAAGKEARHTPWRKVMARSHLRRPETPASTALAGPCKARWRFAGCAR